MDSSAARERRAQGDRDGAIGTQAETVTNKHLWLGERGRQQTGTTYRVLGMFRMAEQGWVRINSST